MKLARKVANLSSHRKYRYGGIVVKSNRLISVGVNKDAAPKRFVKAYRSNLALHAEVSAILNVPKESTKNATFYLFGETAAGNGINSKPCKSCMSALDSMGIKRVVYEDKGQLKEIK